MAGQSFAQVARKLELVAAEFDGGNSRQRLTRVGKQLAPEVDAAVRGTLGDQSMSGWSRSGPIEIAGVARVIGDGALFISAGKASGPMRVLQDGRNQGNSGGMAGPGVSADGSTRRTKSGNVVRARARKARRWNGTTRGKGTWDAAAERIADRAPGLVAKEVHKAIGKHVSGG